MRLPREGRREAVDIVFVGVDAFGFEENLVGVFVGESNDLCLDTRAVAGANALYLAVVEWRVFEVVAEDLVGSGIGVGYPAGHLFELALDSVEVGEMVVVVVAGLLDEFVKMDTALVDTSGCAGLHARGSKTEEPQLFGETMASGFSNTPTGNLRFAEMQETVEKSAVGKDDSACFHLDTEGRIDATDGVAADKKFGYDILPDIEVVGGGETLNPLLDEAFSVALTAWTPHGRTFAAVEHTELDGALVGDDTHISAESIYLPDNLSFSDTTDSRIATHLTYFVHIHGDEERLAAHLCGGMCGFAPCVSCADDDYVIVKIHLYSY